MNIIEEIKICRCGCGKNKTSRWIAGYTASCYARITSTGNRKIITYCKDCGSEISGGINSTRRAKRCPPCREKHERVDRLNRSREDYRKRVYGISFGECRNYLEKQNYRCAICDKNLETWAEGEEKCKKMTGTHLDHDHQTKRIRGVLCSKCNMGLGQFHDDAACIKRAIEYLESYR